MVPVSSFRHRDINILGRYQGGKKVKRSVYVLNGGSPVHFYVEPDPETDDRRYPYGTRTPSVLRLSGRIGHFNIEIPIDCPKLRPGLNSIRIHIENIEDKSSKIDSEFSWDPRPVALPLELCDLTGYKNIQQIGQVVNGAFEIDCRSNVIRSVRPGGADILLLLGSPYGSQEATYDIKFPQDKPGVFIGMSDFFAGHEEQFSNLGIKPGYSTAGLATITPKGKAQTWMAVGDLLMDKPWSWVVKNMYPPKVAVRSGVDYSVRHQVIMGKDINFVRYRIWRKHDAEPKKWLCEDNNAHLDPTMPRISKASFGLFLYGGSSTEWSNIVVRPIDIDIEKLDLRRKKIFVGAWRKTRSSGAQFLRSLRFLRNRQLS